MMKAEKSRRKAVGRRQKRNAVQRNACLRRCLRVSTCFLLLTAYCLLPTAYSSVSAQKKPKPALSEKEARRVIAETPGFKLSTGAVKIKEISPAGATPVIVLADVKTAFHFLWVEDERAPQTTGIFKQKRWRAFEFRTGERAWDEFGFFAATLGAERLEAARAALERLVAEFEAKQRENGGKPVEPFARGPLVINLLSAMGSSVVAEVTVKAAFTLGRNAQGKWLVSEVSIGGEPSGDLATLWQSVNARKAERARADLLFIRTALEEFRRERGFYVVAEDSVVLMDHLSPRYIKRIVRLDPWHNPYRYAGTTAGYTLNSDGPDNKAGTPDDVGVNSKQ